MKPFCLLGALSLCLVATSERTSRADIYEGHFTSGPAWSVAHLANTGSVNPSGNWLQRPSGDQIFHLGDQTPFALHFHDDDQNGLDEDDQLTIATFTVPVFDHVSGSVVGSITFSNGQFDVGSPWLPVGGVHDFTLGGSIGFDVLFTAATTLGGFQPDQRLSGSFYFQSANLDGARFNGIDLDDDTLSFSLWGDTRAEGEGPSGNYYGSNGSLLSSTFPFGIDLNVVGALQPPPPQPQTNVVPEPVSLWVWAVCLGALALGRLWHAKRMALRPATISQHR